MNFKNKIDIFNYYFTIENILQEKLFSLILSNRYKNKIHFMIKMKTNFIYEILNYMF